MKRIIVIAALATVAACSQPAPEPAPEATAEATTTAAAAPLAADGKPTVGKYEVTAADGKVITEEIKADGTYTDTVDGKVVETGKWVQKSPAEYCYTKDEEGAKEVCNTEQVDAKGVWTSVNPEGKTATIKRL